MLMLHLRSQMMLIRIKLSIMLLFMHRSIHITTKIIFLNYMFYGCDSLFLFHERKVFEAEHANDLYQIDRNKGTNPLKETKGTLENETLLGIIMFYSVNLRSVFLLNILPQRFISGQGSIFLFRIIIIYAHH